ncbi:MAG: hypothetical protein HYW49_14025 [Deltaproteobacteria bacterium]|nr:hypothetical protein [Deltaproteobacteria bacterium]
MISYRRAEHLARVGRAIQDGRCPFLPSMALLSAVKRNDRRMALQTKRLHREIFGEFLSASA